MGKSICLRTSFKQAALWSGKGLNILERTTPLLADLEIDVGSQTPDLGPLLYLHTLCLSDLILLPGFK